MRFALFVTASAILLGTATAQDLEYTVEGLSEPAEIIIDEWGVPHIYAGSHYDTFFVQGFNVARDRLWQIDTWRRRGLGLLSEVLGEQYVEQDRASRLFLYHGDMYPEWLAYGSDAKRIAEAFTAGINAYIDLIGREPGLMPVEFTLLDYTPSRWAAADVVRIRTHGIMRNVANEVHRAKFACASNLETAEYWIPLEPAWETAIPDGLDPCSIPDDVLRVSRLARASVNFDAPLQVAELAAAQERGPVSGSNNWTIGPANTTTGRPILANDPHRGHSVPSLRYIAHLVGPGLDVIGAGEPALPGVSIGHNERIAFGLTVFGIDQEDLYVYQRSAAGYRYRDGWQAFEVRTERIPVRDAEAVEVTLKFTRHGPVIYEDDSSAYAIRGVWSEPGTSAYFGSVEYMRSKNWREFVAALNRWGTPAENQVYADIDGNIGYKPAGMFPRRPNWDGLLPVPGDGRYEWDGFHDMDVMPEEYNPERGFSATANSMNLPDNYPIERYTTSLDGWAEPWRYDRLWKMLEAAGKHSMDNSVALQRDYTSLLAKEFQRRLPSRPTRWVNMLRDWDANLAPDSAAAALYIVWIYHHLKPAIAVELLPEAPELVASARGWRGMIRRMDEIGDDPVIALTLERAAREVSALLGDDPRLWRWGDLHKARFTHPLLGRADPEMAADMRLAEHERGGSGSTTNVNNFRGNDFSIVHGASFSMVLDVGNWDESRMTNTPGQSGDPRSPFYDNLLAGWAADRTFPLIYSRDRVLEHEAFRVTLKPAAPAQ